eukprot:5836099-Prymnesium_polylepis.1
MADVWNTSGRVWPASGRRLDHVWPGLKPPPGVWSLEVAGGGAPHPGPGDADDGVRTSSTTIIARNHILVRYVVGIPTALEKAREFVVA